MRNSLHDSPDDMRRAHVLAQSGDLNGAARICRQVLNREASNFYALFMLGSIESQFRRFDEAEKHLARAVKINPRSPEALTSYGNILIERQRADEGIACLSEAIRLQPQNPAAFIYRGFGHAQAGRHEDALKDFDAALRFDPQSVFALHNRASALIALSRFKEARPDVEKLLRLSPNYAPVLTNYALILMHEKKYSEALRVLDRALVNDPKNPDLMNSRAQALMALKRFDEALASCDKALALKPDSESLHITRGNVLGPLQRNEEAFAAFEKALQLNPASPEAHINCANILMEQGRLEDALAACGKAIAAKADYAPSWVLRANILLHLGRHEESLAAYDRAVEAQPSYAEAYYNRGSTLLLHGRFKQGWSDFEHRWDVADCGFGRPMLRAPQWRGEPLAGRSIVIYSEQGLGDAIQFARFLPMVVAAGATVTFLCHPTLVRMFQPFAAQMEVTPSVEASRRFDFQCALMSLPERFGTEIGNAPNTVPYVFAESLLIEEWGERIGKDGLKVGICWQGNPSGKIDKGRSIPLREYRPLALMPGVRLISLQRTHGLEQLAQLPNDMRVETLGTFDEGKDGFIDTAAIMQNLDLVVSSDTSTAHLAGALGRPVWVALKYVPDWRWMLRGSESPWYPTMRLFRQPVRDDWGSVFAEMAEALRALAARRDA